MAAIQQCSIQPHKRIELADNNFSIAIRDCDIVGHPDGIANESYGIIVSSGNQATIQFINCKNPSIEITVAQLPAELVAGLMFNVKDA